MVYPRVKLVAKEDIDEGRTWLRKCHPDAPRRAWVDVEHALEANYPGGLKAFLDRNPGVPEC